METVRVGELDVAYLTAGAGPLALCLHGFPDTAHTWRHLLPQLADAGYRAVAPFTRGYAPTAVPADGRYQTGALAADANALHEAFDGDGDAVIIGHDWGAPSAYGAAGHEPDRWSKVVGMAVPPGGALATAFVTDLDQVQRSWYMFLFQHPLAELLLGANEFALVDRLWAHWSPGYDAAEDAVRVRESLGDPANLHAALAYYRAALGNGLVDPALAEIQVATGAVPSQPTLYLHGRDDGCVGAGVAELAASMTTDADQLTVEVLDHCGHFLHLERPDDVNDRILEFLA
ncbi:MAG: alpha/beta fold hydrolase [Ilumatobacteraceae bacterium]